MGLEFDLRIVSEVNVPEVEERLASHPDVQVGSSGLSARGVESIVVTRPLGRASRGRIVELFGISPGLTVSFVVDCDVEDDRGLLGVSVVLRLAMRLIESLQADGVLLFNGDVPVFIQVGGRLTVNSRYFGGEAREDIFGVGHLREPMPVL